MLRMSLKLAIIGLLMLVLLIPPTVVCRMSDERGERRDAVIKKVSFLWGDSSVFAGPAVETGNGLELPVVWKGDVVLNAETRNRGIYRIPVYSAEISVDAKFRLPAPTRAGTGLILAGMHQRDLVIKSASVDGQAVWFVEGKIDTSDKRVLRALLPALAPGDHTVNIRAVMSGVERLHFLPAGEEMEVHMKSSWPHPNFSGSHLPAERKVTSDGFDAVWRTHKAGTGLEKSMVEFARPPHTTFETEGKEKQTADEGEDVTFGVDMYMPVDIYQQIERAAKYAILFIALTFLSFFIFEALNPIQIHPLQYLFVGLGLGLFFLLLLAVAEHIGFAGAYLAASAADVGLIVLYAKTVLRSNKRALALFGVLTGLYTFLYTVLQLEMYSLLIGSIGLFAILAVVMYITRNIDWYSRDDASAGKNVK